MKPFKDPIPVTKPFLPPLEEYTAILRDVWGSGILTHHGPKTRELEEQLKEYLRVDNLAVVTNGTLAIQLAIRALGIKSGEIITTPFSWIATASAIAWEGATPVFGDIDPKTFNLSPQSIRERITKKTKAILPVHVFSNPCDIDAIQEISEEFNLPVIYDAAHAFGVTYKGKPIVAYGSVSALSFHATKLFNTAEGGACTSSILEVVEKIERLRFFGHDKDKNIVDDGTNAKMTEIHAALGLVALNYAERVLNDRKEKYLLYKNALSKFSSLSFQMYDERSYNFSYFPVVFGSAHDRLCVENKLKEYNVFARRYFYPSLNTLPILHGERAPVSEDISERILCLPLYYDLAIDDVKNIIEIISGVIS